MTREEFLKAFQQKLRVAEPERSSIIAEVSHHLNEVIAGDGIKELGDPQKMAEEENRVHIGVFGSPRYLLLLPWAIAICVVVIMTAPEFTQSANSLKQYLGPTNLTVQLGMFTTLVLFFMSSLSVGLAIRKIHNPGITLLKVMIMSVLAGMVVLFIVDYLLYLHGVPSNYMTGILGWEAPLEVPVATTFNWSFELYGSFGTALFSTGLASIIALVVSYFSKPLLIKGAQNKGVKSWKAYIDGFFGLGAAVVAWWLLAFFIGLLLIVARYLILFFTDSTAVQNSLLWSSDKGSYIISAFIVIPAMFIIYRKRFKHYAS